MPGSAGVKQAEPTPVILADASKQLREEKLSSAEEDMLLQHMYEHQLEEDQKRMAEEQSRAPRCYYAIPN